MKKYFLIFIRLKTIALKGIKTKMFFTTFLNIKLTNEDMFENFVEQLLKADDLTLVNDTKKAETVVITAAGKIRCEGLEYIYNTGASLEFISRNQGIKILFEPSYVTINLFEGNSALRTG